VKPVTTRPSGWEAYYRIVRRIPRGRVATYAQVAFLAGRPRGARQVGYALAALHGTATRLPWQRVLGKRTAREAGISIRDPVGAAAQRDLLEREGVEVDARGRVALERFGWRARGPREAPGARPRPRGGHVAVDAAVAADKRGRRRRPRS
jgi:methylated-DNA-protein-cysteine methyltransferase-like protein